MSSSALSSPSPAGAASCVDPGEAWSLSFARPTPQGGPVAHGWQFMSLGNIVISYPYSQPGSSAPSVIGTSMMAEAHSFNQPFLRQKLIKYSHWTCRIEEHRHLFSQSLQLSGAHGPLFFKSAAETDRWEMDHGTMEGVLALVMPLSCTVAF